MAKIKVRMKEAHLIQGRGVLVSRGKILKIEEVDFDRLNAQLGFKLERLDKPERVSPEEAPAKVSMEKPKESVKKA